jgi:hypothetical protein
MPDGSRHSSLVYAKSIIVVALCTAFVIGFYAVLQYEASGIGNGGPTSNQISEVTTCPVTEPSCVDFTLASANLRVVNYTDELGPVSYAVLAFDITASTQGAVLSLGIYINGTSVLNINGPFRPSVPMLVNVTLPATAQVFTGRSYSISVEGFYGTGSESTWETVEVTATS